jgi:cytochrome bd-type quinol oxidase subunit 2
MQLLGTILFAANSFAFLIIGLIIMVRLREAKGSLRLAKISIASAAFCAAVAFMVITLSQFVYDPSGSQDLLVKQLYVPSNLFAMLVVAFMASFSVFATYSGGKRKMLILIFFLVALAPTAYLTLHYPDLSVSNPTPAMPESYTLSLTPVVIILFALCGLPLGMIPVVAFGRSVFVARKRKDRTLSRGATMMFLAVLLNFAVTVMFVFPFDILRFVALVAWIPIELFLVYALVKTTGPAITRM